MTPTVLPVDNRLRSVNEPVVETLVTGARQLGIRPVPIVEEDGVVQPVLTTVPMTANRIVERAINDFLQNRRSVLRTWASRSHTYFPMIEKTFAEEGVPDELKYLALQESSLYPTIRSTAGAVGMWQFMAATARSEGLRVDEWVDERRDPEKATRAAAKHLKALNESYQGNWHLSLAGYNCSYRCITRSVEKAGGSIENPPAFWEIYPHLPQQTREFVPRFIAASLIVSNPTMYGIQVQDLGQELAYDIVEIEGMLSLEDAARFSGTDVATIRNLNPALLRGSLPEGNTPYALKIPLGNYDTFVSAFSASSPQGVPGAGEYIVKSGDSLDRIARQHDITVDELRSANNLQGNLIKPKQKLLLPGLGSSNTIAIVSKQREFVAYGGVEFKPIKLGEEFQLVRQSGSTAEQPLMAVSLNLVEPDEGVISLVPTVYKVRRGDTLGAISQRFGVSVASIQTNNKLNDNKIFPDQELTIHAAARASESAAVLADTETADKTKTYQVQNGDSLYQIARRFGVSVDNLKRLNRLRDNRIYPGQSLSLN
ncbi:MAG: LysM peptidoglycan-binding domain-containing protein [Pseudomonadota bacterium]